MTRGGTTEEHATVTPGKCVRAQSYFEPDSEAAYESPGPGTMHWQAYRGYAEGNPLSGDSESGSGHIRA
eukprot:1069680-Rhodomonas_salina.3